MRHRRPLGLAAWLALAALLVPTACLPLGPSLPDRESDIRGTVSDFRPIEGSPDTIGSLVVRGSGRYDYAVVVIREDTKLFDDGTSPGGASGLAVEIADGDMVEVWFEGPVAESHPVQATAGAISVIGEAP